LLTTATTTSPTTSATTTTTKMNNDVKDNTTHVICNAGYTNINDFNNDESDSYTKDDISNQKYNNYDDSKDIENVDARNNNIKDMNQRKEYMVFLQSAPPTYLMLQLLAPNLLL
jgi:hypothetical protein